MYSKKIKSILTLGIVFLSIVSVAQAAPPLQGRSGISQGHALDLDAKGNNLGAVVSSSKAEDGTSGNDGQNRVAAALANHFDEASYEEIIALHESGVGFGNIAKAYFFTSKFDLRMGVADLVAQAGQSGWGNVLKDNGIHPGSIGKGNQPKQAGAKANNGRGNGNDKGTNGQQGDNGNNSQEKGNNGQGKAKGNGNAADSDGPDVDSDDDGDEADDLDGDNDDEADSNDDVDNGNSQGKEKGNSRGNGNNGQGNGNGNSNQNDDDDN